MIKNNNKLIIRSLFIPLILIFLMWIIKLFEDQLNLNVDDFGIYPRTLEGIRGIVLTPLFHGSIQHLINNSLPFLFLSTCIFYFYKELGYKIFFLAYLLSGLGVWLVARESYHIGASGLIYCFSSFIFFSGVFRKYSRLAALSLLVVFLYGSMVWGVLPAEEHISWESHLSGAIIGLILAIIFRKSGPQRPKYSWELEELEMEENNGINEASTGNGSSKR